MAPQNLIEEKRVEIQEVRPGGPCGLAVAGTAGWFSLDKETRGLLKTVPTNRDLLFWTQPQRDAAFRALDRISLLAKWHVIPASASPLALPPGPPLQLPIDIETYMAGQRSAGLVVLHNGKLRLERYGLDFDKDGRWTSFSGGQVVHLDPGGRGAARRLHQEHGRQGQRLHPGHERLGLRRRERAPAAHHDLGRALERRLRRPQRRRGKVQQPQTRRWRGCAGQLHAQAAP